MDITQIMITAGAVLGIVIVALLAVVPTVMEIPAPEPRSARPADGTAAPVPAPAATALAPAPAHDDHFHLAA